MRFWLFFLFAGGLSATINQPLRCEIFSGYRNDRIHWHMQEAGDGGAFTYSELYRDVEYWENGLVLKVVHRDLAFFLRGSYGAFGEGNLYQHFAGRSEQPHFHTHGWTADGVGYFGYAVNLTQDRTYKVILTPLVGYSAYFEQLQRKSLPGIFKLVWNGFFLGAGFTVEPGGRLVFNAGYSYHFMHNRTHSASIKASDGGNHGHTGWGQMDYMLNCTWRIGIGGLIHYFTTRVVDVHAPQFALAQKLKLRWTAVSGWAQISREF